MISFLRGTLFDTGYDQLTIEVGGVGYQVTVHPTDASQLKKGDNVFIYTYLLVREDALQLFGFLSAERLRLFKYLISASGIGPKTALAISGTVSLNSFVTAVCTGDVSALVQLPGIGKKTAQKLLVELKDKLMEEEYQGVPVHLGGGFPVVLTEAREALQGLGFVPGEVEDLLQEALKERGQAAGSDDLVKYVLQRIGRKGGK